MHRLTDGQKVAFVDVAYNIGVQAFCGSSMARRANAGDMAGACDALLLWNKVDGRDVPGLTRRRQAQDALRLANARVKAAQDRLDAAVADLDKLHTELSHVQTQGTALQSDLAAGRRRLPVLVHARPADPARPAGAAAVAGQDTGAAVAAELDPAVAAGLARLTGEGDAAIVRLNACIAAYDAVIRASNETE